jgi:heptose I phosphotransferase
MKTSLWLAPPIESLWRERDPFVAVEALTGVEYRALEGRRTFRTEIAGRGFFVKIHRGVGWREIIKNLLTLRLPILGARNEFVAVNKLADVGVASMRPVAFGERGRNPARQHSFLITEELAPTQSLDVAWRDAALALTPVQHRALINEMARMTRTMHAAGLNHRDLYLCHFLLHTDTRTEPCPKLSLIDLHRAQLRPAVPRRWRDKDLAGLYFSALEIGLGQREACRFLRVYFGRPLREIVRDEAPLLARLERKGQAMRVRYQRKYAPRAGDAGDIGGANDISA